jgi:hypothetical protein
MADNYFGGMMVIKTSDPFPPGPVLPIRRSIHCGRYEPVAQPSPLY